MDYDDRGSKGKKKDHCDVNQLAAAAPRPQIKPDYLPSHSSDRKHFKTGLISELQFPEWPFYFLAMIGSCYFMERLELLHSGTQRSLQPGRERGRAFSSRVTKIRCNGRSICALRWQLAENLSLWLKPSPPRASHGFISTETGYLE